MKVVGLRAPIGGQYARAGIQRVGKGWRHRLAAWWFLVIWFRQRALMAEAGNEFLGCDGPAVRMGRYADSFVHVLRFQLNRNNIPIGVSAKRR
jgi:hypothetical protein